MSNYMNNPLFKSVCELLGITDDDIKKYLENPMPNMTRDMVCDAEKEAPKESPAIDHADLPNRMNPEGKSDNQLKAEGWNLVENFEKRDDGAYVCKRVWTKSEGSGRCGCQKEDTAAADSRKESDLCTTDAWMNKLDNYLLSNWSAMRDDMYRHFPKSKDEIDSILEFIKFSLDSHEGLEENGYPVSKLWESLPLKNAYAMAEALDRIIGQILNSTENMSNLMVTEMGKLHPEARDVLVNRLVNYVGVLKWEIETVTNSMDIIEPEFHHMNILRPYFESPTYSMICLWYSLLTEYLADMIEIINKIISANKVL